MSAYSPRVFIVEDETLIQMELADRLTHLGYTVCGAAARGESVLEGFATAKPDLVLMDINLASRMNGIETASRLRELTDIPIVFLTAFSDPILISRAMETNPSGYLVKPFEERELHATIQAALTKYRLERALRAANERLEAQVRERTASLDHANRTLTSIIENLPAMLFMKRASDLSFERLNKAGEALLGYSRDQLIGKTDYDFFSKEQADHFTSVDRDILANDEPKTIQEEAIQTGDGVRYLRTSKVALRDADGKPTHLLGISMDITDRKLFEMALRESEDRLHDLNVTLEQRVVERTAALAESERFNRGVLDALEEHVAVLDGDGRIVATNRAWRGFAVANGLDWNRVGLNTNYLEICESAAGEGIIDAHAIAGGIREVIAGRRGTFAHEYSCQGPERTLWFLCRISRFSSEGAIRVVVAHHNVTSVHEALERAAEGERIFASLVHISPVGIFRTDAEGGCVQVNARWLDISGLTADAAMGDGWTRAIHPDDRVRVAEVWEEAIRTGISFKDEYRFQRPDGSIVWVIGQADKILSADGVVTGYMGTLTDVSDRKLAEEAMRAISTEMIALENDLYYQTVARRLAGLLNAELAFVCVLDESRPHELTTAALVEDGAIVPNIHYPFEGSPCAVVMQGSTCIVERGVQQAYPMDAYLREKGIEAYAADPLLDLNGRVIGEIGVLKRAPVVDRAGTAQVLKIFSLAVAAAVRRQRGRRQYRDLFEFAPIALLLCDRQGGITQVNRQVEELFGWTRAELIGQPVEKLVPGELEQTHRAMRREFMKAPRDRRMASGQRSLMALRKDGGTFHAEIDIAPVETESGILIAAAIRDVTTHRVLEEQLAQATKMEALGKLTGGLAHDFNNYLSVIIGNLDILKSMTDEGAKEVRLIDAALNSAERSADLTKSLLAFARRQPLEPQTTDLNARIASIATVVKPSLGRDIVLKTELSPDLWPAKIDRARLDSCMVNLANNARDVMPRGGTLTIATRNIHIDAPYARTVPDATLGDFILIEISDTGQGMAPDVLAHVFEPFFTTKGPGHGTGLGLSMVYGFVKQSGGNINIHSEVGKGTTVRIYLPRVIEESVPESPKGEDDRLKEGAERILVVEDNEGLRRTVVMQLASLGYHVAEAESGDAALVMLIGGDPQVDLLFSDVEMPGRLNGNDLAAVVLDRWPGIRVLLTSGFPSAMLSSDDKSGGKLQYLGKPYRLGELARAIRVALDGTDKSPAPSDEICVAPGPR